MPTLLYVDDDSRRLQVLPARLELLGHKVVIANNGPDALEVFKHRRFDLAIVDYYMPGMGGDLVALEMKRARSDVPIVMFSGAFRLPELVIALVDGFVSTADGAEALLARIAEILPRPQPRRARRVQPSKRKGAA